MEVSDNTQDNNVYSANDPLDINELASLNEDYSADFIEQLQNQISQNNLQKNEDLFEEVPADNTPEPVAGGNSSEDAFMKKFKAKQQKKQGIKGADDLPETGKTEPETVTEKEDNPEEKIPVNKTEEEVVSNSDVQTPDESSVQDLSQNENSNIEALTGGNITERPFSKDAAEYNKSLDYLDNNVKYSKYVIYIDPENKDFIDSLTVKERKNLINRIIRDQDSIAMTKQKLSKMQTVITHAIVAALTVTIAVPVLYWAVNASMEATINNYRNSKTMFNVFYKEKGKINNFNNIR